MLRKTALTILAAAAVTVFLSVSAGAVDHSKFLAAAGKETIVGIQPGEVKCAGGVPTGQHFPNRECSPETNRTLVRGEVDSTILTDVTGTAAAMLSGGTNRIVVNCNLDRNLKGECWGTFELTVPGQGKWEGSWNGPIDLVNFIGSFSFVGHGSGGQLDGLQMKYDEVYDGTTPYAVFTARVNGK
jgi:hypothetical protein